MDYCSAHFGKKLQELTFQDIENFFSVERIETDQLEFKSIGLKGSLDEKFTGIQRTVGAFLNSSGGLLIWGAPEGKVLNGKKGKAFVGALTPWNAVLEKDFVVSKVSDSITPLPEGIRVNILSNKGSSVAVIEVDTSSYSPHQTNGAYYMRIDGQTKPAPHHYIEALFRKVKYPNIEAIFKIKKVFSYQAKHAVQFQIYFYNWTPLLNEEKLHYRIVSEHGIFEKSSHPLHKHRFRSKGQESYFDKAKDVFHYGEPILVEEILLFNPHSLSNDGNRSVLLISFGGKFSPLKTSKIVLDFSCIQSGKPMDLIHKDSYHNKLHKDIQEKDGLNRDRIIKNILEDHS